MCFELLGLAKMLCMVSPIQEGGGPRYILSAQLPVDGPIEVQVRRAQIQSSTFSPALTGSLECRMCRNQESVPCGTSGRGEACHHASCAVCSLVIVNSTSLRTEGDGSKLRNRKGTKLNASQCSGWRSGRAKRRFPLGLTQYAAGSTVLDLSPYVSVSELHAAQFGDTSPLPTLWLYVGFWGTAAGTYGYESARLSCCSLTHLVCSCCLLQEKKNKKQNQMNENGLVSLESL